MKVIENNIKGFDNIRTAVLINSSTTPNSTTLMYLGKTTKVSNNDFIKYGFSFFTENNLLINQIHESTLKYTKEDVKELELIEQSIFPTLVKEKAEIKYFGSTIIDNTILFIYLDIPEGIDKVELYDTIEVDSTNKDNCRYIIEFEKTEEVNYRKGLCIFFDREKEKLEANIIQKAWLDDSEPLRNLDKTFLSKEDFKKSIDEIPTTKSLSGGYKNYITDIYSGLLLGNTNIYKTELLSEKYKEEYKIWDSYSIYKIGDNALWDNKIWTSLSNNNSGNLPNLTAEWEIKENLTNYYTKNIEIGLELISEDEDNENREIGDIYPDKILNIYPNEKETSFYIELKPGYLLTNSIFIDNNKNLLNNNSYGINLIKSQDYSNIILLNDTDKISKVEEIIFKIDKKTYRLTLTLTERSIELLNNIGKSFNEIFELRLKDKLITYRTESDTVISYEKDEEGNRVIFFKDEEYEGEEYNALVFSNEGISPKFRWDIKKENDNIEVEVLSNIEDTTTDTGSIEIEIKTEGEIISDGSIFLKNENNKMILDDDNNPVLNIDTVNFRILSTYYLKNKATGDIIYYYDGNKYHPYLDREILLEDRITEEKDGETKEYIKVSGKYTEDSLSSRLVNKTGIAEIQTNNFSVNIYDNLVISKLSTNTWLSVNKVVDNFNNIIVPEENENNLKYTIIPTKFDEQDLTIDYIIDLIETSYEVKLTTEDFEIKGENYGIILDKTKIMTSIDTSSENNNKFVSFNLYFRDEYYNKVTLDNARNSIKIYNNDNNKLSLLSKSNVEIKESDGTFIVTINNITSQLDLVIKYDTTEIT